jgi:transglutaminase-like putative cysteine protease
MKQFKISHLTTYQYASVVDLLDHRLLLRPREGHELRIVSSSLSIFPQPKLAWHRDVEGNSVAVASFSTRSDKLEISSEITIEKYDLFPFDFLMSPQAVNYPFLYAEDDLISLTPYMQKNSISSTSALIGWVGQIWDGVSSIETFELLLRINQKICQNFTYEKREEEGVQTSSETITKSTGSCRDFATLFMEVAQYLGFAARFVSGYINSTALCGATHAWVEVFLPGAGWKGFDPTNGSLVGGEHISVAVARRPEFIPPVSGKFFGAIGSTLSVGVSVTELN